MVAFVNSMSIMKYFECVEIRIFVLYLVVRMWGLYSIFVGSYIFKYLLYLLRLLFAKLPPLIQWAKFYVVLGKPLRTKFANINLESLLKMTILLDIKERKA